MPIITRFITYHIDDRSQQSIFNTITVHLSSYVKDNEPLCQHNEPLHFYRNDRNESEPTRKNKCKITKLNV